MGTILFDASTQFDIPGVVVTTWKDNPIFSLSPEDFRSAPSRDILQTIIHNTRGDGPITAEIDGIGPSGDDAENNARYWRKNKQSAAAQILVDSDGSAVQTHYLQPVIAWHAGTASIGSVGIECVQRGPASGFAVYSVQAKTAAAIIAGMIALNHPRVSMLRPDGTLAIRTQYNTRDALRRRIAPTQRGVYGHRDVDPVNRGLNDPGDALMRWVLGFLESEHGLRCVEV